MNTSVGAAILVATSLLYLGASIVTGHSASSAAPATTDASSAGRSALQAAGLLIEAPGAVAVIDTRSPADFALYHLPRAINLPGASAEDVQEQTRGKVHVLLVGASDGAGAELLGRARAVSEARANGKQRGTSQTWHYLIGGARTWYLAFELPIPLFSDKPPPFGYHEALDTVRRQLDSNEPLPGAADAWRRLQSFGYAPTALHGKKGAPSTGTKRISGGCGG